MINRRKFVRNVALASAAGMLGYGVNALAAAPPPETKKLRLGRLGSLCVAPQYVAHRTAPEGLLPA